MIIPFFLELNTGAIVGSGRVTVAYNVPTNQELTINGLVWTSTGAWGFSSMRNANGQQYTNASQATPFQGVAFQQGGVATFGMREFPVPLVVRGSDTVYFEVQDTSGAANAVLLSFFGSLNTGGSA